MVLSWCLTLMVRLARMPLTGRSRLVGAGALVAKESGDYGRVSLMMLTILYQQFMSTLVYQGIGE